MRVYLLFGILFLSLSLAENAKGRDKCRAAVYAIERPSNGKVQTCCNYSKARFVCDAGYKLVGGNKILECRKGRIYGKFSKCILAHNQTCGLAGYNPLGGRIFGGSNSRPGNWPWMAAIYRDGHFACGGALITPSYVLTAAHCFYRFNSRVRGPDRYHIWLGRTKLNKRETRRKQFSVAERIYINENFSMITFSSDIAIIKLKTPVKITKFVKPLCLPEVDETVAGRTAYVAGWGKTGERRGTFPDSRLAKRLQYTWLPLASDAACASATSASEPYLRETMLCAGDGRGERDACTGDSGGPLVVYEKVKDAKEVFYKWTAVGIVSWGDGCARVGTYGYYTRVFAFVDWIKNIVGHKA